MVQSTAGTLITCDPAAKELIMHWNKTERFVLKSIDERRVLVKTESVELIHQRFRELNDELNYDAPMVGGDD
jgi:hypothetical protein